MKINFRKATAEDLKVLPQIGEVRARHIIEKMKRPETKIKDVYELSKVSGLGVKRMEAILDFIKENDIKLIY